MTIAPASLAVIGLGIMGGAIARHLVAAGFAVTGFDIDPEARARATASGVAVVQTLEAAFAGGDATILSLTSAAVVESVIATAPPGIVVDTSTLDLDDKLRIEATARVRGVTLLDCPISGTGAQMAVRDAVLYASGDGVSLQSLRLVFEAFSRDVFELGAFGNGTRMKLLANHLVAIHNVATAEVMRIGMAAGLDSTAMIDAVQAGAGASRIFGLRAPMVAADCYEPATMKLSVWAKDMDAIARFAATHGASTPLLDATVPLYAALLADGAGDLDTAAVARALGPGPHKKDL